MIFVTSDTHFGHDRGFIYEPRGFSSIGGHDEEIIYRWNSIVTPEDTVYHLGDAMLGSNHEYGLSCLNRLNGHIIMIRGNHDTDRRWEEYEDQWPHILPTGWAYVLKHDLGKSYLCHYPTETSCLENMTPIKHHLINLHGHTHSTHKFEKNKPYQYNVALDAHNCCPVSLKQVYADINKEVQQCLSYL